jgi:hypothetical protein
MERKTNRDVNPLPSLDISNIHENCERNPPEILETSNNYDADNNDDIEELVDSQKIHTFSAANSFDVQS